MRKLPRSLKPFALGFAAAIPTFQIMAATIGENPNLLWYDKPATKWVQALPVGNGRLGGMIFGGTTNERVQLNDITVWSGGTQQDANRPDAWTHLADIRRVIREGHYDEGAKLCNQFFNGPANYDISKFQTLGDLNFEFQLPSGDVTNYTRWLDIDSAVAGVEFTVGATKFQREIFASAPDKVLVQRLTASKADELNFTLTLNRPEKAQTQFIAPDMLVMTGSTAGSNLKFQANARVLLKGGKVTGQGDALKVEGATEAMVLLTANTSYVMDYSNGYKGADPAQAAEQVKTAAKKGFNQLKKAHVADYQKYFHRVSLDLGSTSAAKLPTDERLKRYGDGKNDPALAALFFQYGRYLLISCSRADNPLPANLQGLWADGR